MICLRAYTVKGYSSVHTTRVHGPCSRTVSTAREHGYLKRVSKMTLVFTGRGHCSWTRVSSLMFTGRAVSTARGHG